MNGDIESISDSSAANRQAVPLWPWSMAEFADYVKVRSAPFRTLRSVVGDVLRDEFFLNSEFVVLMAKYLNAS